MSGTLELRKNIPSGTIVLNRPDRHNAISRPLVHDLLQALEDFQGEKNVHGLIITAKGTTFCSGSDLGELHETSQSPDSMLQWQDDIEQLQTLLETMLRHPKPIVVALNGDALGLGAALVLAADLVIAHPNCGLLFPEPKWGLSNCVGAALLAFRSNLAVAAPLLLADARLDANRALTLGLFHEVVPTELVWARAHELVQTMATHAPSSISMTKRFVNDTLGESLFTNLSIALAQLAAARTTESAREGIAAFLNRKTGKH